MEETSTRPPAIHRPSDTWVLTRLRMADEALRLLCEGELQFLRELVFGATFVIRRVTEPSAFEADLCRGELAPLVRASRAVGHVKTSLENGRPAFYLFHDERVTETCESLLGRALASALTCAEVGLDMRGVLDVNEGTDPQSWA